MPDFPPLIEGFFVAGDPMVEAVAAARLEADPGRLWWRGDAASLSVALELAPELSLERAMATVFATALGLADAVGVLAPPEVGVLFVWPDKVRVNGATCGRLLAAAPDVPVDTEPDWMVVGAEVALSAASEMEPGQRPHETSLAEEGCAIGAEELVEAFARHTLSWIYTLTQEGIAPLHRAFIEKLEGVGEAVPAPHSGTFVGLDEHGGMILRTDAKTTILPLSTMLQP